MGGLSRELGRLRWSVTRIEVEEGEMAEETRDRHRTVTEETEENELLAGTGTNDASATGIGTI